MTNCIINFLKSNHEKISCVVSSLARKKGKGKSIGKEKGTVPDVLTEQMEEDLALCRLIADSNEDAFKKFHLLTKNRVEGYCMKQIGGDPPAKDIAQEAYIKFWKKRKCLATVQYPRAYLIRLASREIYKHLKKEHKLAIVLEQFERENALSADVQQAFFRKEKLQLVEQVVKTLPEQQQQVFRLHKYDGFTYKEIAEKLGISISAVSNYMEIAMKKVRAGVGK